MCCCLVTVEAAAQNLTFMHINNSEVLAMWNVNPSLFELSHVLFKYSITSKQPDMVNVINTFYQMSDLIPGETYIVSVTAMYKEKNGKRLFPANSVEGTVKSDVIGR